MVLIAIITGVYKPTYNWGAPPCGIRPCWGLPDPSKGEVDLPEDGILGEAWPAQLDPWNSWINHGSQIHQKPCDVSIYTSKKSTKNYQKRSKTIENNQKLIFQNPRTAKLSTLPLRIGLATDQQAVSQLRGLITRASGGDEVGKERKALEQLPKVLQTQWGRDELIRGIIPKWLNLKKSVWITVIYQDISSW